MNSKIELGQWGEELVAVQLSKQGWSILARNWRCSEGELDIVAWDGTAVVAVEVKTRSSALFGDPLEAVDFRKQRRLRHLLGKWLESTSISTSSSRVDVVSVLALPGKEPILDHVQAVA